MKRRNSWRRSSSKVDGSSDHSAVERKLPPQLVRSNTVAMPNFSWSLSTEEDSPEVHHLSIIEDVEVAKSQRISGPRRVSINEDVTTSFFNATSNSSSSGNINKLDQMIPSKFLRLSSTSIEKADGNRDEPLLHFGTHFEREKKMVVQTMTFAPSRDEPQTKTEDDLGLEEKLPVESIHKKTGVGVKLARRVRRMSAVIVGGRKKEERRSSAHSPRYVHETDVDKSDGWLAERMTDGEKREIKDVSLETSSLHDDDMGAVLNVLQQVASLPKEREMIRPVAFGDGVVDIGVKPGNVVRTEDGTLVDHTKLPGEKKRRKKTGNAVRTEHVTLVDHTKPPGEKKKKSGNAVRTEDANTVDHTKLSGEKKKRKKTGNAVRTEHATLVDHTKPPGEKKKKGSLWKVSKVMVKKFGSSGKSTITSPKKKRKRGEVRVSCSTDPPSSSAELLPSIINEEKPKIHITPPIEEKPKIHITPPIEQVEDKVDLSSSDSEDLHTLPVLETSGDESTELKLERLLHYCTKTDTTSQLVRDLIRETLSTVRGCYARMEAERLIHNEIENSPIVVARKERKEALCEAAWDLVGPRQEMIFGFSQCLQRDISKRVAVCIDILHGPMRSPADAHRLVNEAFGDGFAVLVQRWTEMILNREDELFPDDMLDTLVDLNSRCAKYSSVLTRRFFQLHRWQDWPGHYDTSELLISKLDSALQPIIFLLTYGSIATNVTRLKNGNRVLQFVS